MASQLGADFRPVTTPALPQGFSPATRSAVEGVEAAAEFLRKAFIDRLGPLEQPAGQAPIVKDPRDPTTVVTDCDLVAEGLILERLRAGGVTHLLSEETAPAEPLPPFPDAGGGAGWQAIIDPLDGTHAFDRGLVGCFGVSCGLAHDGRLRSGVIAAPTLRELLVSEQGVGTYWRRADGAWRLLTPYDATRHRDRGYIALGNAVLYLCRGTRPAKAWLQPPLSTLLARAAAVVCFRSCVVALLSLLCGRLDGVVLPQQRLWDIAGALPALQALGFALHLGQDHWKASVAPEALELTAATATVDLAAFSPVVTPDEVHQLFAVQ